MSLHKILIIDDQFSREFDARGDLCVVYGLKDITGDDNRPGSVSNPLAEALFCSGQEIVAGKIINSVKAALVAASKGWPFPDGRRWTFVLLDLRFVSGTLDSKGAPSGKPGDDNFGLIILKELKKQFPELPVIILSSMERTRVIEDCRRLGAEDFIQRNAKNKGEKPRDILSSKVREYGLIEDDQGIIVGRSLQLLHALASARRAATGGGNILLLGETGTGKELLARYIHDHSPKRGAPYEVYHAFGTAETLQEDLLFGHMKGAFTDAKTDKSGIFEKANGGTLFIDEVGDIPESLQNKLLRPIETRQVMRLGGTSEISLDIQLVLATNKSLDEYVATEKFKFDLLNRIRAYPIRLPSLRERREDIPYLAKVLLEKLCRENGARWPRTIHSDAMEKLQKHDWRDGNVRELRNSLERVVKNNKDSEIVVVGDIQLDTTRRDTQSVVLSDALPLHSQSATAAHAEDWLSCIRAFEVKEDQDFLKKSWPSLHKEIMGMLAKYLAASLRANRRKGKLNLSDAVTCIKGNDVDKLKAADFIKRVLQFDNGVSEETLNAYPILKEALEEALRLRPKKPHKSSMSRSIK